MRKCTEYIEAGILLAVLASMLTSCIATAPVSVAWRSNASQQYATTDGKNRLKEESPAVNADKTTELESAVTTSSGTAATASQSQSNAEEKK